MDFRVTMVQMPCNESDPHENRARARWLLDGYRPVSEREFIILPELFDIGFRHSDYKDCEAGVPGPTSEFMESLAAETGAYVAATGIEQAGNSKYYNTLVVGSPSGRTVAVYRKIHPFQEERHVFLGGDRIVAFEARGLKVGVQICYDIRFPEVTRRMALEGVQLVLIPAAFPDPRSAHWNTLLAARAIENQLYVAACNRIGYGFDGKTYFGHSQMVDPWGVVLSRPNSEERVLSATGDTTAIDYVRRQITCLADRSGKSYDQVQWYYE
ncbi:MAG: hypothetical protein HXY34_03455 [Candidatus Thorarchaeota archaeon]|nr:hypothetical protein [Candidatus Thorarchaeota archaeon]